MARGKTLRYGCRNVAMENEDDASAQITHYYYYLFLSFHINLPLLIQDIPKSGYLSMFIFMGCV